MSDKKTRLWINTATGITSYEVENIAVENIETNSDGQMCFRGIPLHREDGPAVEYASGRKAWYLNGEKIHPDDFERKVAELQADREIKEEINEAVENIMKDIDKENQPKEERSSTKEILDEIKRITEAINEMNDKFEADEEPKKKRLKKMRRRRRNKSRGKQPTHFSMGYSDSDHLRGQPEQLTMFDDSDFLPEKDVEIGWGLPLGAALVAALLGASKSVKKKQHKQEQKVVEEQVLER